MDTCMLNVDYESFYDSLIYQLNLNILQLMYPENTIKTGDQLKNKVYYKVFYTDDGFKSLIDTISYQKYKVGHNCDNVNFIKVYTKKQLKMLPTGTFYCKCTILDNSLVIIKENEILCTDVSISSPRIYKPNKFFI